MNELVNLNQIVSEIKFFENQAVVSYWEIGKRLSKAKKQVGHGNWENWIDENLGYTSRTARRLIKVFDEYPNPTALSDLNMTQALAIASIKDEKQRQEFQETHDVENLTTRKLQEEIKSYKENLKAKEEELNNTKNELGEAKTALTNKERQIEEETSERIRLSGELEQAKNKEPEVVEKEVIKEVEPRDYKELQFKVKDLDRAYEEIRKKDMQIASLKTKEKERIAKLEEYDANKKILNDLKDFMWTIDSFIRRTGGLIYLTDYYEELPNREKDYFEKSVKRIFDWSSQLNENLEKQLRKMR